MYRIADCSYLGPIFMSTFFHHAGYFYSAQKKI
jgi:hypothetical protein